MPIDMVQSILSVNVATTWTILVSQIDLARSLFRAIGLLGWPPRTWDSAALLVHAPLGILQVGCTLEHLLVVIYYLIKSQYPLVYKAAADTVFADHSFCLVQ